MSNIRDARNVLTARLLQGDGRASTAQRRAAFMNSELDEPEAFGFDLPAPAAMNAGAKFLLARGYR